MSTTYAATPLSHPRETDRHDEIERLLRDEIRDARERVAGFDDELARLTASRDRDLQVIEQGMAMLRAIGRKLDPEPEPEPVVPASSNGVHSHTLPLSRSNFVAGNRSSNAPERRPEFANVSLVDAARQLLRTGETMHLDDLAHAIYDIRDVERLPVAKANLRSAMASGVERGYWVREGPGTFRTMVDARGNRW